MCVNINALFLHAHKWSGVNVTWNQKKKRLSSYTRENISPKRFGIIYEAERETIEEKERIYGS